MASETYTTKGLVLKRTKLGESDVICTLLAEDGSQIKAVAKGARKPSSSFTSRLELFSACDLLIARGRNLDIIKEARLIEGNAALRESLTLTEAASPMVEIVERATLESLENPQLYPLTLKALGVLPHVNEHALLGITAAHLIKTVSFLGFKPELSCCIVCGDTDVVTHALSSKHKVAFSSLEGGIVCSKCVPFVETVWVEPQVIQWAQVLLYSKFEEIQGFELDSSTQLGLLRFLQTWIKEHIGFTLKSLTYVFSYGLA